MQCTNIFTGLFFLFLSSCAAKTLDGGSTGDTSGAGTGAPADIAQTPVAGKAGGKVFEAKTIDLAYSNKNSQWFFSIDNYENDCGTYPGTRPDPSEAMTITVGAVQPAAGTYPIKYADGHGATFQIGVYEAKDNAKPDTRPVQSGTLQLDTWDETPGASITGAIKLVADDDSVIEGTFTAKVCPAR